MLLAEVEVFWKPPNVYDVTGVVGFIVGIGSIWLSWRWTKQDIRDQLIEAANRASEAARDEVRRVAKSLLHTGVNDTVRSLELAREAYAGKQWTRSVAHCQVGREQLVRLLIQSPDDDPLRTELRDVSAFLSDCIRALESQPRSGAGKIPDAVSRGLNDHILALHRVAARLARIGPEVIRE